jgi:hypothetical protein
MSPEERGSEISCRSFPRVLYFRGIGSGHNRDHNPADLERPTNTVQRPHHLVLLGGVLANSTPIQSGGQGGDLDVHTLFSSQTNPIESQC